jgi:hypothetical protein
MKTPFKALALAAATLATVPAFAQGTDDAATGVVGDVFGDSFVLSAQDGRLLVTLPEGAAAPAEGQRVRVEGARDGRTMAAVAVSPLAAASPAQAADDAALPEPLRGLSLTDVRRRADRDDGEVKWSARLPEGGWLRAETGWDGRLTEIKTDGAAAPRALLERMVPAAVLAAPELERIATLTEIEVERDKIEVEGFSADGMEVELEFAPDGRLLKMEVERPDRRRWSREQVRARLGDAGYADVGWINLGGRHADAEATNAWGERVEVRLNEGGQIARERAID